MFLWQAGAGVDQRWPARVAGHVRLGLSSGISQEPFHCVCLSPLVGRWQAPEGCPAGGKGGASGTFADPPIPLRREIGAKSVVLFLRRPEMGVASDCGFGGKRPLGSCALAPGSDCRRPKR